MKKSRKKVLICLLILLINVVFIDFVQADTYNNYDKNAVVSCGDNLLTNIPSLIPQVIKIVYIAIQIAVPIVLVIMGMLDLFKAISAQKDDDIKKAQQIFIKRLISAALVFFVFVVVKFVISLVADNNGSRILECADCFISGECSNKK